MKKIIKLSNVWFKSIYFKKMNEVILDDEIKEKFFAEVLSPICSIYSVQSIASNNFERKIILNDLCEM